MPKGGFRNFKQRGGNIDTKAFMESNSLVARAAFVLLVLLVFIVAISIGTTILKWFFSPSKNPKIIDGMKPGTQAMTVSANPQKPGAKPILRSDNKRYGVEFTWSVWLYILDLQYKKGEKKHIFHKGNDQLNSHGMPSATQCPGLYLHETKNALVIVVNTFKGYGEEIVVDDIPLNKWLNIIVRVEGNIMDIYINGAIAIRHILQDVVKQNYGDTHINLNGGFSGNLSDLWYFNWALNTAEILKIVKDGPNISLIQDAPGSHINVFPPYFSLRWYFGSTTHR